ncbi:MAG: BamA/TamA family outer membrane protein [Bacteriovorax sp.]|nr:BamA/TamA family outer membrane protein [Bacteriovorax sp.]
MKLFNLIILTFFILTFESCAHKSTEEKICPKITVHSAEKFDLSDTEKRLICGDTDSVAYKVIPSYQASYMLTAFLQSRGYSTPRFDYKDDLLEVYPDEQSFVVKVIVISESDTDSMLVEKEIMRHYKNELITPKLLDNIETEALTILRNNTYPCAKLASTVDATKGEVTIKVTGLHSFQFGFIAKEHIEGIDDRALARFYPFIDTDYFSEKKLTLAEKRFIRSGVVQGTYFQEKCDLKINEFSLGQQFIPGYSKTIRLGVGASTEVGPMIRAKWSNQRWGEMASLLEANAQFSFKNQNINFLSQNFLWANSPRRSFLTTLEISRTDQLTYEEFSVQLKPHIQWTRDGRSRLWTWETGPTLITGSYKTNSNNSDTQKIHTGAIEGLMETKSHDYELFDLHPEDGDMLQFHFDFRHPAFGFVDPLLKLDLTYLKLARLGNMGKGLAIGGVRVNTSTTWVPVDSVIANLPPSVKFYGGGSDDVRGFKLNSLPSNTGQGALTKFSVKFEFRKTYVFIPTIESFTFVDTTLFGADSWNLDKQLWYSPGTGLRWLSPIGMVQGYVARGFSNESERDYGNFFYLGLGGMF